MYLGKKILSTILVLSSAAAVANTAANDANPTILQANNQASIDLQYINQNIAYNYNNIRPGYLEGRPWGLNFGITKTFFDHLYTQLTFGFTTADLGYSGLYQGRTRASSVMQQFGGRLGYSFYPTKTMALTPYITGGFQYWQIDTGGSAANSYGYNLNGFTQIIESQFYGLGLLGQWAVTPKWVVSADATAGRTAHPWTRYNGPNSEANINGEPITAVIYQQANMGSLPFYQLAIGSDYLLTSQLHGRLGIQYNNFAYNGSTTNPSGQQIPTIHNRNWTYSAGLGYSFAGVGQDKPASSENTLESIIKANNQAAVTLGYLYQNYGETVPNQSSYLDRQQGGMPQLGMNLVKTFHNIYTQLALSTAIGNTSYKGGLFGGQPGQDVAFDTSTRNTILDTSARLGYMFFPGAQVALTPYGVAGFHRWLRDTRGINIDGDNINGYPETYQHGWYGLGLLTQWAPFPKWVLSLDGNLGYLLHPQNKAWVSPGGSNTVEQVFSLQAKPYYNIAVGTDYEFARNWHVMANVDYLRFRYGASDVSSFHLMEPNSSTRELTTSAGLGYSFG